MPAVFKYIEYPQDGNKTKRRHSFDNCSPSNSCLYISKAYGTAVPPITALSTVRDGRRVELVAGCSTYERLQHRGQQGHQSDTNQQDREHPDHKIPLMR
ncbi:hypothetical protein [Xylophilus sp.]|uniref:hypothetical protein n=1 Tax=Xylophilus sp. TaxID=2653893 RepID=UPI0013B80997|nr:hypothetical protein [Xylophilus sp.]KAF1049358.1 MAG: hypothetical protein GAK38_00814 [Xylophilus sp.]